jgi:hypothetical protein
VNVPPGTVEYQQGIRKSKDYLIRLEKGKKMLEEAMRQNELLTAQKILRTWNKLANEMFLELEMATLLHQSIITGNKVLVRANGRYVKFEELANSETIELDPWLLLSLEKLKYVFGDDIHDILEIHDTPVN